MEIEAPIDGFLTILHNSINDNNDKMITTIKTIMLRTIITTLRIIMIMAITTITKTIITFFFYS